MKSGIAGFCKAATHCIQKSKAEKEEIVGDGGTEGMRSNKTLKTNP